MDATGLDGTVTSIGTEKNINNMKSMNFVPATKEAELFVDAPKPAEKSTPKWFKDIPAFASGKVEHKDRGGVNSTSKICMPFSDSFKMGYIQETWQDIKIEQSENHINYFYPNSPQIISHREETHLPNSVLDGYYPLEFTWNPQWLPKVPKGYSVLITHPLNRDDLPFKTLTGVIDADEYFSGKKSNLPFLIKKGFDGVIPVGTPIFQIIPFKREDWKSQNEAFDEAKQLNHRKIHSMFYGGYKKLIWKKKSFK